MSLPTAYMLENAASARAAEASEPTPAVQWQHVKAHAFAVLTRPNHHRWGNTGQQVPVPSARTTPPAEAMQTGKRAAACATMVEAVAYAVEHLLGLPTHAHQCVHSGSQAVSFGLDDGRYIMVLVDPDTAQSWQPDTALASLGWRQRRTLLRHRMWLLTCALAECRTAPLPAAKMLTTAPTKATPGLVLDAALTHWWQTQAAAGHEPRDALSLLDALDPHPEVLARIDETTEGKHVLAFA